MIDYSYSTAYATAERASEDQCNREADLLLSLPLLEQLLDSIPDIVLILNKFRQIVFANQTFIDIFNVTDKRSVYGLRPGEALQCIHADENRAGCGTTPFCITCGAVSSILSGLHGKKEIKECRISQKHTGIAFDILVSSTPLKVGCYPFVIFVAKDISHEKRRNVLERSFFHDISNTLAGVVGYSNLIPLVSNTRKEELLEQLGVSIHRLQAEINSQKELVSAESGDLCVYHDTVRSREMLHEMADFYQKGHFSSSSIQVELDEASIDLQFISDKILLSRVLGNMLKNALEATQPNGKISTGCKLDERDNNICFWVRNAQFIPQKVQLQIFNRSFSTKGKGRGIGTYSMKLLTEKYLKGTISFTSTEEEGTIFSVSLPRVLE